MKEQLKPIFDAAADEITALSRKRMQLMRKGQAGPDSFSKFQEQRRTINRSSMEQARQLLSGLSSTDLINFAALYFAEYHRADRERNSYKGHFLSAMDERKSLLDRMGKRDRSFKDHLKKSRSKGATALHVETYKIKADVFAWLDSLTSEFKSTEAAARAIVKQQPIAHDTARKYFKEWKKLRSASTP